MAQSFCYSCKGLKSLITKILYILYNKLMVIDYEYFSAKIFIWEVVVYE